MAQSQSFKITFSLDESDVAYFRKLFRHARKSRRGSGAETEIIAAVQELIDRVRTTKKTPTFVPRGRRGARRPGAA